MASNGDRDGVWIIVPSYNEMEHLPRTLAALTRAYKQIVLIDDGSTDATRELAGLHDVWYLRHTLNRGQGAALQTGIDFALHRGAQIIVTFDADGQHAVDDIDALVRPIWGGRADVCLGSRFLGRAPGITWMRWLLLKAGVVFTRVLSRIRVTDTHNGLRAFSRRAAEKIRIYHDGMAHASEILDHVARTKLRFEEVPVTVYYTADTLRKGQPNWNSVKIVGEVLAARLIR